VRGWIQAALAIPYGFKPWRLMCRLHVTPYRPSHFSPATPRLLRLTIDGSFDGTLGERPSASRSSAPLALRIRRWCPVPLMGHPTAKRAPLGIAGLETEGCIRGLRECLQNGNVHPFTGTPRDCASATLRHLVRQNLVILCISGVDVYLRRRKATAANEPHVAGPRRLTSCEPIGGLLTRHPRRPIAWSRQTVLPQTRGDEASRAQVRRPSRKKTSMSGGSVPQQ
jgi:hypothetical protein